MKLITTTESRLLCLRDFIFYDYEVDSSKLTVVDSVLFLQKSFFA